MSNNKRRQRLCARIEATQPPAHFETTFQNKQAARVFLVFVVFEFLEMKKKVEEKIAEDWCFCCYEGGDLRICDYTDCLKSYHTYCVNKDESFLEEESEWFCNVHICYKCHKSSDVHCICCPRSVCWRCVGDANVVQIEGGKGFCSKCLNMALMIEENLNVDSDGNYVDFNDLRTNEGLFKEYWEIINKEEGLTLEKLHSADAEMMKGNIKKKGNKKKKSNKKLYSPHLEERDGCGESEISDSDGSSYTKKKRSNQKMKRSKNQTSVMKKKEMRTEFLGWGSKTLIQFLESIGVDVSEHLSQYHVSSIISRYIRENKLFHPDKKKQVVCDANLQSLFGRKTLNKHKISEYLDPHFAENQPSSEEDEIGDLSEDENSLVGKRQRKTGKYRKFEVAARLNIPQCHYASICPGNINLVYLRRTLVQKLLEEPDSFESKLIGSFVIVKSDPNDYLRRKPHQLMQVIGTTRDSSDKNNMKVLLMVPGSTKPISINFLSECDITEEDCEELKQCIKSGLLKQPTIAELQEKAIGLHEDRMKHWIARELKLLQNRIDQANEKGWRKELFEYLEALEKLKSSKEHLLQNVPNVIAADLREFDLMSEGIIDDKQEDDRSLKSGTTGSQEKDRQQSKACQSSPFTSSIKACHSLIKVEQNTGNSLQALDVQFVDLTRDGNSNKTNAATQTEEVEDTKTPTCYCISPDCQKKAPSPEFPNQCKVPKSVSSEYKVCVESGGNAISLHDAVAAMLSKKPK